MTKKKKKTKLPAVMGQPGRPTKYEDKFCEMLIEHMANGYSIEAFAGKLRVSKQSIYTWFDKHPRFMDARKKGDMALQFFYENVGIMAMMGDIKNFNLGAWIWLTKNRLGWKDKSDDLQKPVEPIVIEMPLAGKAIEIKR
jgi:hypothetical protein